MLLFAYKTNQGPSYHLLARFHNQDPLHRDQLQYTKKKFNKILISPKCCRAFALIHAFRWSGSNHVKRTERTSPRPRTFHDVKRPSWWSSWRTFKKLFGISLWTSNEGNCPNKLAIMITTDYRTGWDERTRYDYVCMYVYEQAHCRRRHQ